MKKKVLSIVLSLLMVATCALTFIACSDPPIPRVNEEKWKSYFAEVNFNWRPNGVTWTRFPVTESEYYLDDVIYGVEKVEGQDDKYYKIENNEEIAIDSSEFNADYTKAFAPLFTFLHDNFNNFTKYPAQYDLSTEYFVYEQELPADVLAVIGGFVNIEEFNSLVVECNEDKVYTVWFLKNGFKPADGALYENNLAILSDFGQVEENAQLKEFRYQKDFANRLESAMTNFGNLNDGTLNFKVVGGAGVDYMEIYFNANGMRFYTPNAAGQAGAGVDGIYYNDNGTYKYYKQETAGGEWTVETIDKERYDQTLKQMFDLYCGGHWFRSSIPSVGVHEYENKWYFGSFENQQGLMRLTYSEVCATVNGENQITGATWKLTISQMGQEITYNYTLTKGIGQFDVPNV